MKVGKRIYFENQNERKEFIALLKDAKDSIEAARIISKTYNKDITAAMEIAEVYFNYIRKDGRDE